MKRAPKLTARSGAKSGAKPGAEAAKKTPKRAPKKLSAPKAKAVPIPDFRDSVEHAVHGVMIHRNFRPLYANAAFARLFGCKTAGELLAMPLIRPLIPPDNWARMETHHDAVMRDGRGGDLRRERMLTQGGQEIWVALTERKIKWQGGSAVEWHAFDITGQMHGEQELLATEQRLRAILEVLPYPIIIAQHPGGQILFVNRKTCLLLSQSAGGTAQKPHLRLLRQ
ncbi:MAG: PAS domain-containing protein [Alphaproteobacteria bacterium]